MPIHLALVTALGLAAGPGADPFAHLGAERPQPGFCPGPATRGQAVRMWSRDQDGALGLTVLHTPGRERIEYSMINARGIPAEGQLRWGIFQEALLLSDRGDRYFFDHPPEEPVLEPGRRYAITGTVRGLRDPDGEFRQDVEILARHVMDVGGCRLEVIHLRFTLTSRGRVSVVERFLEPNTMLAVRVDFTAKGRDGRPEARMFEAIGFAPAAPPR